jgi:hypothetical protein
VPDLRGRLGDAGAAAAPVASSASRTQTPPPSSEWYCDPYSFFTLGSATFSEFVNGWLRDPVLRQVVAAASGKRASGFTSRSRARTARFQLRGHLKSFTNPKVISDSCVETNTAGFSAVTSSRFA